MLEVEEKEEDVNIMFDPRVPWPHAVARELTALAKICTDKNSKRRPLMDEVGFFYIVVTRSRMRVLGSQHH